MEGLAVSLSVIGSTGTLGEGVKRWDKELICPIREEACLIVTNSAGKQCGLRMAYGYGKIIPVPCQGHGGAGLAAIKFRLAEGTHLVYHLPLTTLNLVDFFSPLSAAIAGFCLSLQLFTDFQFSSPSQTERTLGAKYSFSCKKKRKQSHFKAQENNNKNHFSLTVPSDPPLQYSLPAGGGEAMPSNLERWALS